jgi:AcrR family transcriptional regulator
MRHAMRWLDSRRSVDYEPAMAETARGRPRAEPREEQHERILAVARAAFTRHGYDGVTMSSIARDANVPRPVVYEVVGSKEQLLAAVADQVADELIVEVDARFSRQSEIDRPADDVVRDDIRWFVGLVASKPEFPAILRQSQQLGRHGDDVIGRARRRLEDRITELHIDRGRAFSAERVATARVLSVMILAIFESVAVRVGEPGWPSDAVAELVGEFAAGGYVRTELSGASATFEERAGES